MLARSAACVVFLSAASLQLAGCASVADIQDVRELPGMTARPPKDRHYYDPSIRAYRVRATGTAAASPGRDAAAREPGGRKVRTEEELDRLLRAHEPRPLGAGAVATTLGLAAVYSPLAMAEAVVAMPWGLWLGHLVRRYQRAAEAAYAAGRAHFANARPDRAAAEWDRALVVMPSLRAFSDVDYWRGRAFEAAGRPQDAAVAYRDFLDYSERPRPAYFKASFAQDPSWEEKARDAERRLGALASREGPA